MIRIVTEAWICFRICRYEYRWFAITRYVIRMVLFGAISTVVRYVMFRRINTFFCQNLIRLLHCLNNICMCLSRSSVIDLMRISKDSFMFRTKTAVLFSMYHFLQKCFRQSWKCNFQRGLHTVLKFVQNSIFRIKIISRLVEYYWKLFGGNQ